MKAIGKTFLFIVGLCAAAALADTLNPPKPSYAAPAHPDYTMDYKVCLAEAIQHSPEINDMDWSSMADYLNVKCVTPLRNFYNYSELCRINGKPWCNTYITNEPHFVLSKMMDQ